MTKQRSNYPRKSNDNRPTASNSRNTNDEKAEKESRRASKKSSDKDTYNSEKDQVNLSSEWPFPVAPMPERTDTSETMGSEGSASAHPTASSLSVSTASLIPGGTGVTTTIDPVLAPSTPISFDTEELNNALANVGFSDQPKDIEMASADDDEKRDITTTTEEEPKEKPEILLPVDHDEFLLQLHAGLVESDTHVNDIDEEELLKADEGEVVEVGRSGKGIKDVEEEEKAEEVEGDLHMDEDDGRAHTPPPPNTVFNVPFDGDWQDIPTGQIDPDSMAFHNLGWIHERMQYLPATLKFAADDQRSKQRQLNLANFVYELFVSHHENVVRIKTEQLEKQHVEIQSLQKQLKDQMLVNKESSDYKENYEKLNKNYLELREASAGQLDTMTNMTTAYERLLYHARTVAGQQRDNYTPPALSEELKARLRDTSKYSRYGDYLKTAMSAPPPRASPDRKAIGKALEWFGNKDEERTRLSNELARNADKPDEQQRLFDLIKKIGEQWKVKTEEVNKEDERILPGVLLRIKEQKEAKERNSKATAAKGSTSSEQSMESSSHVRSESRGRHVIKDSHDHSKGYRSFPSRSRSRLPSRESPKKRDSDRRRSPSKNRGTRDSNDSERDSEVFIRPRTRIHIPARSGPPHHSRDSRYGPSPTGSQPFREAPLRGEEVGQGEEGAEGRAEIQESEEIWGIPLALRALRRPRHVPNGIMSLQNVIKGLCNFRRTTKNLCWKWDLEVIDVMAKMGWGEDEVRWVHEHFLLKREYKAKRYSWPKVRGVAIPREELG